MYLKKFFTISLVIFSLSGCISTGNKNLQVLDYAQRGDLNNVVQMFDNGSNIAATDPKTGNVLLNFAIFSGNIKLIQALITRNADVNVSNHKGYTPLMFAALKSNQEAIKLLAKHGVNFEARTLDAGATAYMFADSQNDAATMKLLINLGAKVCRGCRLFWQL